MSSKIPIGKRHITLGLIGIIMLFAGVVFIRGLQYNYNLQINTVPCSNGARVDCASLLQGTITKRDTSSGAANTKINLQEYGMVTASVSPSLLRSAQEGDSVNVAYYKGQYLWADINNTRVAMYQPPLQQYLFAGSTLLAAGSILLAIGLLTICSARLRRIRPMAALFWWLGWSTIIGVVAVVTKDVQHIWLFSASGPLFILHSFSSTVSLRKRPRIPVRV